MLGGAAVTLSLYNYTGQPITPYWVDPQGLVQLVPDVSSVPAMTGATPFPFPTYNKATLIFQLPKGGVKWIHVGAQNTAPHFVLGVPPKGAPVPKGYSGKIGPAAPAAPAPVAPPAPAPVAVVIPSAPGKTKTVNSLTIVTPGSPNGGAPAPASAPQTMPGKDPGPAGTVRDTLNAEDPQVIEFLQVHNAARSAVGAPPLEWSNDLAKTAQEWADHIAQTDALEHRPASKYGENIAWGTGGFTSATAANAWLAEKAMYDHDAGNVKYSAPTKPEAVTGHYTQMVWAKSTMVGFGLARGRNGRVVVVANYNPSGNIDGEKPY